MANAAAVVDEAPPRSPRLFVDDMTADLELLVAEVCDEYIKAIPEGRQGLNLVSTANAVAKTLPAKFKNMARLFAPNPK